jgi:two-component system sensor histidine kinase/response regulator
MKHKILLVDDELTIRDIITELLILKNYDVKTAPNGHEALYVLENWTPDLIICDIVMPIMDGNIFQEIVKENQLFSSIPFIFLSAKNEIDLMRKCLSDGADDFLSKPFKANELVLVIKTKIERFEKIKNAHNNLYLGKTKSFLHEINTPLNGILGLTEVLISNQQRFKKSEIQEVYESIQISGKRLNRTLQNIILYQNFKNNLIDFEDASSTEILKTFLTVKKEIFHIYKKQEARISFEIDEAIVKINEKYLDFILFELIDNALKFSSSSKMVVVSGERHDDEYYTLIIKDFGIGLSEDELRKIGAAQQFNRKKIEQQGLGLGLFLSKIIVKKTKGVFTIVSKLNEGTCIKLFFPLSI